MPRQGALAAAGLGATVKRRGCRGRDLTGRGSGRARCLEALPSRWEGAGREVNSAAAEAGCPQPQNRHPVLTASLQSILPGRESRPATRIPSMRVRCWCICGVWHAPMWTSTMPHAASSCTDTTSRPRVRRSISRCGCWQPSRSTLTKRAGFVDRAGTVTSRECVRVGRGDPGRHLCVDCIPA